MHWHLVVMVLLCLVGCSKEHLHTAIHSQTCIKPFKAYRYKTCSPINFTVDNRNFTIPADFETDLASVPRLTWSILSPAHSSIIRPAIIHDWFYRKTCDFNRLQTDLIFYHMLINDGVSRFEASILYYGVRIFGGLYYNEDYCHD